MAEYYQVHFGNSYNVVYGNIYPPSSGTPAFSTDSTSGKAVPTNSTEWLSFLALAGSLIPPPQHVWQMQEVSGTLADSIGTNVLTVSNATYNKTITGWTRKAVGGNGAAVTGQVRNLAMADTATTSVLVLIYAQYVVSPTALRSLLLYGTPTLQIPAVTQKVRLREGAALLDSTLAHDATIHPFLFAFNVTNSTCKVYTDLEKLSIAYSASVGTALTLSTSSTSDTSITDFVYGAAWEGINAETTDAEAKKLITALGYSPPWT